MRNILMLAVLGAVLPILAVQAKIPISLKSEEVKLPESSRTLPEGPGAAVANGNCLTCHSASMILYQPVMAKAAWQAEVAKMRNVYKAPVDDKDVPTIVDYLTSIKGPK